MLLYEWLFLDLAPYFLVHPCCSMCQVFCFLVPSVLNLCHWYLLLVLGPTISLTAHESLIFKQKPQLTFHPSAGKQSKSSHRKGFLLRLIFSLSSLKPSAPLPQTVCEHQAYNRSGPGAQELECRPFWKHHCHVCKPRSCQPQEGCGWWAFSFVIAD